MSTKTNMTGHLSLFDEDLEELDLSVISRQGTQLITFMLGQEKYGLKILSVRVDGNSFGNPAEDWEDWL